MTPQQRDQVRRLFAAASEANAAERDHIVRQAASMDREVGAELERLLQVDQGNAEFLDVPILGPRFNIARAAQTATLGEFRVFDGVDEGDLIPHTLASYRLVRVIGRGTGGIVTIAEPEDRTSKPVALKLFRDASDVRSAVDRLKGEANSIYRARHPYIIRLLENVSIEGEWAFFVMEYVDGPDLGRYCREIAPTLERRLEMFIRVCEGVQAAHDQSVVHLDLKPSNVLVDTSNRTALPRIIDFGLATIVGHRTSRSDPTRLAIGTPAYMAPERADIGAPADCRSDVFALGAILYELLLGRLPVSPDILRERSIEGLRHALLAEKRVSPIDWLESRPHADQFEIEHLAATLGIGVPKLYQIAKGPIGQAAMRAMSLAPEDRFESAADLALQIRAGMAG